MAEQGKVTGFFPVEADGPTVGKHPPELFAEESLHLLPVELCCLIGLDVVQIPLQEGREVIRFRGVERQFIVHKPVSYTHLDVYKRQPVYKYRVEWSSMIGPI